MDILTAKLGANMAKSELAENGQIGYTETSAPVVVIPDGSYEFSDGEYVVENTQCPKAGDPITLTLDGVVYSGAAKEINLDGLSVIYIGNAVLFGEDTGENYMVGFIPAEGSCAVYVIDEASNQTAATHTVELSFQTQTIHPIDPKYLPGVCLPVVELSFEQLDEIIGAGESGVVYTEGTVFEEFEAAFSIGLPCVIRAPALDIGVLASIMSISLTDIDNEEFLAYSGNIAGFDLLAVRAVVEDRIVWAMTAKAGA